MSKPGDSSSPKKWSAKKLLAVTSVTLFVLAIYYLQNTISVKSIKQPEEVDLKYILLWTPVTTAPFSYWSIGQVDFIKSKCPVTNCYITNRTDLLGGDMTKFDALVFNGRSLKNFKKSHLPKSRSIHQKYIFMNLESSDNEPICDPMFDGFFNWTATYKLNSDIVFSYFLIRNMAGEELGPRIAMTWVDQISGVPDAFTHTLDKKTKAVAWFVSHCRTRSLREKYAEELKESLKTYNMTLDIYGKCGPKTCPRSKESKCRDLLKSTYFFYLSFENSFAEDYVTEKALAPLLNNAAPIIYGGANYSRFLPPGSYLDATKYTSKQLASIIVHLMATPAEYRKLFWWRSQYSYHKPNYVCRLCLALNNQTNTGSQTVYRNFRRWWNRQYEKRCKDRSWGS